MSFILWGVCVIIYEKKLNTDISMQLQNGFDPIVHNALIMISWYVPGDRRMCDNYNYVVCSLRLLEKIRLLYARHYNPLLIKTRS